MFPARLDAFLKEEENLPVDVSIKDREGGGHLANKALLASKSKFFKGLFSWSPPQCKEFALSCHPEGLAASLAWVVTGEVQLNHDNAVDMMILSDYLGLMELSGLCQQVGSVLTFEATAFLFSVGCCSCREHQRCEPLAVGTEVSSGRAEQGLL